MNQQVEKLTKALETFTAGTVARGVLWIIGVLSAKIGVDAPDDDVATKIGAWAGAIVAIGLAYVWSRVKDRIWKDQPPGMG